MFHFNIPFIISSPLAQFEIYEILSIKGAAYLSALRLLITNIVLYLMLNALFILVVHRLSRNYNKLVSNNWSISLESLFVTILNIITSQIKKNGLVFLPFIYALFTYILMNNLIGLIPYSFASTSHFAITFFLSFTIVLGVTIIGFIKHRLVFFSLFVPAGCPLALLPLLVLIEFI